MAQGFLQATLPEVGGISSFLLNGDLVVQEMSNTVHPLHDQALLFHKHAGSSSSRILVCLCLGEFRREG